MAMNHFMFTQPEKAADSDMVDVEMELTPQLAPRYIQIFTDAFEIPMLQSERKRLPGGNTQIKLQLPVESAAFVRQALMDAYSRHSGYQTAN